MKRRFSSHITLIELISTLLFLMLAMATITGLFTKAYGMSQEAERVTRAVQLAQSYAALIESGEDPVRQLADHGYESSGERALILRTDDETMVCVELDAEQTEVGTLYEGRIRVEDGGKALVEWPVSRYMIRK